MSEFMIGDEVWVAAAAPREVARACPVCFGKREVVVILGDDSRVVTPCEYCGKGFEGPRGTVIEYDHTPRANRERITGKSVEERRGERAVRYFAAEGWVFDPDDVFADEAAAFARAREKADAAARYDRDREERTKSGTIRNVSWVIGYHRKQAKDARRSAEYHEARAVELAALARGESTRVER